MEYVFSLYKSYKTKNGKINLTRKKMNKKINEILKKIEILCFLEQNK